MYNGEKLNSITHLVGAVFALIGFGALLATAIGIGEARIIISYAVFGITLVVLYTISTLYHSFHPPKLKKIFRKLDHISIYLLIAGTYTPFMLVSVKNENGLWILLFVWSLAIIGILLDTLIKKRREWLQILIYLIMGWSCSLEFSALREGLSLPGIIWLTTGGILYTVGITFYMLDEFKIMRHAHGIWHLFVLSGSSSHFVAVIAYVR